MIKIGNCYLSESQIAAIQPSADGTRADVHLVNGGVLTVKVLEDDLRDLLGRTGIMQVVSAAEPLVMSPSEEFELKSAYENGCLFVAKDKNGQVFAYKEKPQRGKIDWACASDLYSPFRLRGDFDFLSFEDEEPLDLDALFGGFPAEGE